MKLIGKLFEISNNYMKELDNNHKIAVFKQTPRIATYLYALAAGPFE